MTDRGTHAEQGDVSEQQARVRTALFSIEQAQNQALSMVEYVTQAGFSTARICY